jgi:hypothetical protein
MGHKEFAGRSSLSQAIARAIEYNGKFSGFNRKLTRKKNQIK